ncbi:hypothetical protein AX774_g2966 [Zancudomyces culisetae]|uniref:Uncharacterized protein n=1 Tax=Zancudomyces culisetae TaxID=1213189 RepID=A0A1R1PRB6_ZANCU|nr:hypothetical protein AX774_g2966 [Zancudomyces culisetae]|eukprot:OMH83525.1 hypothetical protein AX774_g2966 [Zancudomyces culisetae]
MSIKTGGGGKTLAKPPYVVKPSKNIIESDSGLLKRKREKIVADIRKDTNRKNKGIASDNRRASIASNDDMWLGLEAEIEQALNDDDHKGTKNEDVGVDLFGSGNEDSDGEFEDVHMD